jgi:hypothetical protein
LGGAEVVYHGQGEAAAAYLRVVAQQEAQEVEVESPEGRPEEVVGREPEGEAHGYVIATRQLKTNTL